MKRLVFAFAVLGLMACAKPAEEAAPVAEPTPTPVAAPATDSATVAAPADTTKHE